MAETQTTLKKSIKPSQAWALALGAILGWGAFVLPALRFLPTAGPLAACIGFALGGAMLVFVAMSYGDMIGKYPVAGGEFVFAYVGFGPTAAFICGWALALGYICIIALNASALALLFRFLLPGVFEVGYLYTVVGWDIYAGELAMLIAILVGSGWINYRGADLVGKIQVFLAIALVGGVFALFAGTVMHETSSLSNLLPLYAVERSPMASIMAIVAIAPWLYVGFDTIPQAAEEFDFPHEMATKLMVTAIVCGVFLYAMVTLAVAGLMPYKELLALDVPWATGYVAHLSLGKAGSVILAMAVSAAIFTGINGFFLASSRLLFSIGRARILPAWFGDIHPKYGTPHKSIVFVTLLTIIAPFFGREVLNWVVDMSAVGTVIGYLFTCLAAYKVAVAFRSEETTSKKIIFAAIGSVSSVICILLLTVPGSPGSIGTESWIALVLWTLLGAFFYKMKMGEFKGLDLKTQSSLMMGGLDLPTFFKK